MIRPMVLLYLFILLLFILALFSLIVGTLRNRISPMPSSYRAKRLMVSIVKDLAASRRGRHGETAGGVLLEPGSGWATVSIALARALPHWTVIGIENSLIPYLFSIFLAFVTKNRNLRFYRMDFLKADFSEVDIVVCYLYREAMKTVHEKIVRECSGKTLHVVSNTFVIPGITPQTIITANDLFKSPIYVYTLRYY